MKVLLVATNREDEPFPVAPVGALCVASAARAAGHGVELLDLGAERRPGHALRSALVRRPAAVAFSIRNLDNAAWFTARSYLGEVRDVAEAVRRASRGPLILGGSGFSVAPEGWMQRLGADYGVVGEGERAFVDLLGRLAAGRPAEGLAGVVTARSPALVAPGPPIDDLDTLEPPAHELCRYRGYLGRGGFVSVQTKRGCPFGCSYCVYPGLEGRRYRLRSPSRVADEVAEVVRASAARHVFFVDSVFNHPRGHALEVCAELTRRRLPARWMAFCNPVDFDRELAAAMVTAGCVGVEFGLDAATDKMLAALHKPFRQGAVASSLSAAHAAGLPFSVHLLFGGPGETWHDVEEAQRFLDGCAPAHAVFASFGIRVYEGTPLARQSEEEGMLARGADLFEPTFYVSPALAVDPRGNLDRIVRRRAEWSSPVDWNRIMMRAIQKFLNRVGARPQWLHVRNYGLYLRRGTERRAHRP